MKLSIKRFIYYFGASWLFLIFSLGVSFSTQANILLDGDIKIGDNDTYRINPTAMLRAQDTHSGNLFFPQPVNPIHFNLTESVTLTRVDFDNITNTSANLYLVIWKDDWFTNVVVNTRSSSGNHGVFNLTNNVTLSSGDYFLAIVGQCFNPGGQPKGWSNNCSGNWNYDDFEYTNINLHTTSADSKTNSFAFIERRHIGDSTDSPRDGYADRWYPDSPEGDDVEYYFTPKANVNLESITIYNYRDLVTNRNNVELTLSEKDGPDLQSIYMNRYSSKGDFIWTINKELIANTEYELEIEVEDDGDADDISWDDIVIKMGDDITPLINHYRIIHPENALTCESASVIVQACSNDGADGNCERIDIDDELKLNIGNDSEILTLTNGFVTVTGLAALSPSTLALSVDSVTNTYCNSQVSATGDTTCDINFADIGLQFSTAIGTGSDIGNQVAGVEINSLYLRALESDGNGTCSELTLPNANFNLGVQCKDSSSCDDNLAFSVTSNIPNTGNTRIDLANNGGETSVGVLYVQDGVYQILNPVYDNAGLISLSASYQFSNTLTLGASSNDFAVRPDRFNIKAVRDEATKFDLTERDSSGLTQKHAAGDVFTFRIQAVNTDDVVTSNYVPLSADNLRIKLTRTLPSPGQNGDFIYAGANCDSDGSNCDLKTLPASGGWTKTPEVLTFDEGEYHFLEATYTEVGAIAINFKDKDYYGMKFMVDETFNNKAAGTEIGRFIPHHFTLESSGVSNYIETVVGNSNSYEYVFPDGDLPYDYVIDSGKQPDYVANTRVLATDGNVYQCHSEWDEAQWCQFITENGYAPGVSLYWDDAWDLVGPAGSGITYMDQPELIFDYQLEARNSAEVVTQNYDGLDATVSFHALEGNSNLSPRLVGYTGSWLNGVYAPLMDGIFSRNTTPDGPFSLLFGINVEDSDAVNAKLADMDMLHNGVEIAKSLSAEESELRYGRWNIADNYGPIVLPLPTRMSLEYYDGRNFIANVDDNLTTFTSALAKASMIGSTQPLLSGSGDFDGGVTQELLISSSAEGDSVLEYDAHLWLEFDWSNDGDYNDDPSAIINFGFFRGNDQTIYRRRLN